MSHMNRWASHSSAINKHAAKTTQQASPYFISSHFPIPKPRPRSHGTFPIIIITVFGSGRFATSSWDPFRFGNGPYENGSSFDRDFCLKTCRSPSLASAPSLILILTIAISVSSFINDNKSAFSLGGRPWTLELCDLNAQMRVFYF